MFGRRGPRLEERRALDAPMKAVWDLLTDTRRSGNWPVIERSFVRGYVYEDA